MERNAVVEAARQRATSRAAVMQSLAAAYGGNKKSSVVEGKAGEEKKSRTDPPQKSGSTPASGGNETTNTKAVEILMDHVAAFWPGAMDRLQHFCTESVTNKNVVLDRGAGAAQASNRARHEKRRAAKASSTSMSKRKLREKGLINNFVRPGPSELKTIHRLWCDYARSLSKNSSGVAQLTARFAESTLVGALITVLDAKQHSLVGMRGVVTAANEKYFYVAHDSYNSELVTKESPAVRQTAGRQASQAGRRYTKNGLANVEIVQIERKFVVLGVFLPGPVRNGAKISTEKSSTSTGSSAAASEEEEMIEETVTEETLTEETVTQESVIQESAPDSKSGARPFASEEVGDYSRVLVLHGSSYRAMPTTK